MTKWQSYDCLMTAWWLPDDCLMTAWRLPDNLWLPMTAWLPDDCLMTDWWLPDDCLMTAWWLPDDCLTTDLRLPDDCQMTAWWQLKSFFVSSRCGEMVVSVKKMKEHQKNVHNVSFSRAFGEPRAFQCHNCKATFDTDLKLQDHICKIFLKVYIIQVGSFWKINSCLVDLL